MDKSQTSIKKSAKIVQSLNFKSPEIKAQIFPELIRLNATQQQLERGVGTRYSSLGVFPLVPAIIGGAAVLTSGLAYLATRQLSTAQALEAKVRCIDEFIERGMTPQEAEEMCRTSLVNISPLQLALGALGLAFVIRILK